MEPLRLEIAAIRQSLHDEGVVDYQSLTEIEAAGNTEVMFEIFFFEITKTIAEMEQAMQESPKNVGRLRDALHKLMQTSANFGARKLNGAVILTIGYTDEEKIKDMEGVKEGMKHINEEFATAENRLQDYFQLLRRFFAGKI
ncbi:hypothetical protein ACFE04_012293 [Oxalis oulophora]